MENSLRTNKPLKTALHFIWVLLVARIITGLTISQDLLSAQAWATPQTWIAPLGFAVIFAVIYWRNQGKEN